MSSWHQTLELVMYQTRKAHILAFKMYVPCKLLTIQEIRVYGLCICELYPSYVGKECLNQLYVIHCCALLASWTHPCTYKSLLKLGRGGSRQAEPHICTCTPKN